MALSLERAIKKKRTKQESATSAAPNVAWTLSNSIRLDNEQPDEAPNMATLAHSTAGVGAPSALLKILARALTTANNLKDEFLYLSKDFLELQK